MYLIFLLILLICFISFFLLIVLNSIKMMYQKRWLLLKSLEHQEIPSNLPLLNAGIFTRRLCVYDYLIYGTVNVLCHENKFFRSDIGPYRKLFSYGFRSLMHRYRLNSVFAVLVSFYLRIFTITLFALYIIIL